MMLVAVIIALTQQVIYNNVFMCFKIFSGPVKVFSINVFAIVVILLIIYSLGQFLNSFYCSLRASSFIFFGGKLKGEYVAYSSEA